MSLHIHSLQCSNINSLYGSWQIDFDALGENTLYLIAGPTGVGKSTILDAICVAFFGMTPRLGLLSGHEDILHQGASGYSSQVRFSMDGKTYTVQYSATRSEKTKKMRPAQHMLQDAEGKIIASGLSVCRKEIETILGMDIGRFLRTTLLAQGQFASFLLADAKERAGILERITQTSVYGELSIAAYEQGVFLSEELKKLEEQCPEDTSSECRRLTCEDMARKAALTEIEHWQTLQHEKAALTEAYTHTVCEAAEKRQEWQKLLSEKDRHTEANLRLREQLDTYEKLLTELPAKPLPVAEAQYHEVRVLGESLGNLTVQIDAKDEAYALALHRLATKQDILARGNFARLEAIDASLKTMQERDLTLPDLTPWRTRKAERKTLPEGSDALYREKERLYTAFVTQMRIVQAGRKDRLWAQGILAKKPEEAQPLQQTLRRIEEGLAVAKVCQNIWRERREKTGRLPLLRQKEAELAREWELMSAAYAACTLFRAFTELTQGLTEGDACPVCGTIITKIADFPRPEKLVTEDELNACRQKLADISAEKERLLVERSSYNREIRKCLETACPLSLSQYLPELREREAAARQNEARYQRAKAILESEAAQEQRKEAVCLAQKLLAFRKEHPDIRASRLALFERRKQVDQELAILHENLSQKILAVRRDRKELRRLLEERKTVALAVAKDQEAIAALGKNPESIAETLKTELAKLRKTYAETLEKKSKAEARIAQLEKSYAVAQAEWQRVREALRQYLPDIRPYHETKKRAEGLPTRAEHSAWEAKKETAQTRYRQLRKTFWDLRKQRQALPECDYTLEDLSESRDSVLQRISLVEAEKKKNEELLAERERLLKVIVQKREAIVTPLELQRLIGSAKGDRFRVFAQNLTLERVLDKANNVLERMMPRYRLIRDTEEDLGLLVDDDLMSGRLRSVRTLSGGETFVLSLALAMGLSEMNGRSSSLFLDEGFGTLDEESLRMVIAAIRQLSDTGIACGIISHVQELKEAIPVQIHVLPDGQGRSRIEGVGCTKLLTQ